MIVGSNMLQFRYIKVTVKQEGCSEKEDQSWVKEKNTCNCSQFDGYEYKGVEWADMPRTDTDKTSDFTIEGNNNAQVQNVILFAKCPISNSNMQ